MGFNTSNAAQVNASGEQARSQWGQQFGQQVGQQLGSQFSGPYKDIANFLGGQLGTRLGAGDKSGTSEAWRQIDDLQRFMAIMGSGPNAQFDIAQRNLGQRMGNTVGQTQQSAAAMAGSRGLVNPSGFTLGAGTQARQPYVQAQGQLEQGRAQAQQQFLWGLLQYLNQGSQQRAQQNQYNEQNDPNILNYLSTAGQLGSGVGLAAMGLCWVAEAIYGVDDPRTWFARYEVTVEWLESKVGRFFRRLYQRHGQTVANRVKKNHFLKMILRPVFEFVWRSGRKHLWQAE